MGASIEQDPGLRDVDSRQSIPVTSQLPVDMIGSGRAEQLARIAEAGLVREGRVFLLSLAAIRDELGTRWANREETVWHSFERDLNRALPPPDQFVRLDDVTILAAIRSTDAYSGQVRCAQVFREGLAFFLGRNQESDLSMARVSEIRPDAVISSPIDPSAAPALMAPAPMTAPPSDPERWTPPLSSRQARLTFLTEREGPAAVDIWVAPVWRMDRRLVAAYAIRRSLPRPLDTFSDKDKQAIDLCVADFLAPIMEDYRVNGGAFAILCPFSFATLSARSSRLRLFHRCAPFVEVMRRALVLEIDGVERGVPEGRVRETVSMCRPIARVRTVAVHDPESAGVLSAGHGAEGVVVDAQGFTEAQAGLAVSRARRWVSNIVVHGVSRAWDDEQLRRLGASHITEDGPPEVEGDRADRARAA